MRIVLSRKGFDSSSGGVPSPILPDGTLVPLPIPSSKRGSIGYSKLRVLDLTLARLLEDLTHCKNAAQRRAHVDPDLRGSALPNRPPGWRPILGQADQSQKHLEKSNVGCGDLFLFFRWFRKVELCDGCYRYVRGAPKLHVLFGWLQVERGHCRRAVGTHRRTAMGALSHAFPQPLGSQQSVPRAQTTRPARTETAAPRSRGIQ
jgi:Nucleotide modification associated domain 3